MRIGSLCSGYGGLELGVQAVYGGTTAWVSDIDKGACKILAHRFPGVVNIGDMTTVDWAAVEPVDLICGGTPCQDLSHAGKRAGMTEGTRSNLWVAMREAIAVIRPSTVIWENVGGAYSAAADSEMERDPRLLGVRPTGPVLRALGRVLGDLASLGYDASWHGLRAADVGAPHGRFRVFVVARDSDQPGLEGRVLGGERAGERAAGAAGGEPALLPSPRTSDTNGAGRHGDGGMDLRTAVSMLPTPRATDGTKGGPNQRGSSGDLMLPSAVVLLPTPNGFHAGNTETPDEWRHRRADVFRRTGTRHGPALSVVALSVLEGNPLIPDNYMPDEEEEDQWPATSARTAGTTKDGSSARTASNPSSTTQPSPGSSPTVSEGSSRTTTGSPNGSSSSSLEWGPYAAAIGRWETLTRPAPPPTETGPKGNPRLSAAFSEWMMGLPAGWVAGVPGITRNEALRAIGNGVCPQQCAEALRVMAAWEVAA